MRGPFFIALFVFSIATNATADERQVFFGTWGTAKQCAREPIKSGGTVLSEPYEINPRWLRQGRLWCNLSWGSVEVRKDGYFAGTHAQCGEDAEEFREGVCTDCYEENQRALDLHNMEHDAWQKLTDEQRSKRIKDAI